MSDETPIQPRTPSERRAFLTGYAQAMLDIQQRGLEDARQFLRFAMESEDRMTGISSHGTK